MLNRKSLLVAMLIGCVVFIACGDSEDDEEDEVMLAAGLPSDIAGYESLESRRNLARRLQKLKRRRTAAAHTD